ncbi:MAG: S8 family serine peptidase, partial [Bacteroidota bacterium]
MRKHLFFWLFLALLSTSLAQEAPHISGQLLVMLESGASQKLLKRAIPTKSGPYFPKQKKCLSPALGVYLLEIDEKKLSLAKAKKQINSWEGVRFVQYNHKLEHRGLSTQLPNDPNFLSQWPLDNFGQNNGIADADIDAPEAWGISTGGATAQGDTIVVAVIDLDMDLNHEDLSFWKNHSEIPDNGIDDDNNGFIDDFHGWNANSDDDEIPVNIHGTPVAGIIAAKGNNGLGISGLSWDAQIMPLINLLAVESEVVEAYNYVLEMRRRYNESGGSEGAFVVATNASFGIDRGNPQNFPIWCSIYDSLGAQGVLNVAATTNAARDVDAQYDMPTSCSSDFLITVTNTNDRDTLNLGAGFGATQIDLGAPGTRIPSTRELDRYGSYTGTSFAAPHVSGVLALLFSAACPEILTQYKLTPGGMALEFKKWILDGVDILPTLVGKSLSGGRLNAYNSLLLQATDCSNFNLNCLAPFNLRVDNLLDSSALLSWSVIDSAKQYELRYRRITNPNWNTVLLSDSSFLLTTLIPCTEYIFQVAALCNQDSSDFLASLRFRTEGCCEAPASFKIVEVDSTSAKFSWESVFGASLYLLNYRRQGEQTWNTISTRTTEFLVSNFSPCEAYELRLAAECGNPELLYTDTLRLETPGCGICLDKDYCESRGRITQLEWIEEIRLGPIMNQSGANGGYAEFSREDYVLFGDSTYQLTLVPGDAGLASEHFWRVWIDANQDGVFAEDGSELFFETEIPIAGEFTVPLSLPPAFLADNSRMRISMKLKGTQNPLPAEACESFSFGEVEDYCIQIVPKGSVSIPPAFADWKVSLYPNPSRDFIRVESEEAVERWQLFDTQGRLIKESKNIRLENWVLS